MTTETETVKDEEMTKQAKPEAGTTAIPPEPMVLQFFRPKHFDTVLVLEWQKGREEPLRKIIAEHKANQLSSQFYSCEPAFDEKTGCVTLSWNGLDIAGCGKPYSQVLSDGEMLVLHETGQLEVMCRGKFDERFVPC